MHDGTVPGHMWARRIPLQACTRLEAGPAQSHHQHEEDSNEAAGLPEHIQNHSGKGRTRLAHNLLNFHAPLE